MLQNVHAVVATSSDSGWWDDKAGNDYLELNAKIAKLGSVKRVFLYKDTAELNGLQKTLRKQAEVGIDVYTAPLPEGWNKDYVILDGDKMAAGLTLDTNRLPCEAEFYFNRTDISTAQEKVQAILLSARRYMEFK